MIPARLLPVALLLAAMLPGAAAARDGEDPPRIFFEKKVYSDTAGGKQSFFETYTVEKGDSLWEILERSGPLTPDRYAERLKEFRRANPKVADPSHITPGQQLLVPSGARPEEKDDGRTVGYSVKRGDSLSEILSSRDVPRRQWKKYFDAIREINASVTDVDRIFAGRTLRLPTEEYFTQAPPAEPEKAMAVAGPSEPAAPPVEATPAPEVPPATALTRDITAGPGTDVLAAGKPEAELLVPKPVSPAASVVETGKAKPAEEVVTPPARSPYRGLLSDLFLAIGEKWVDRGTMYLPLPSGGDVVLQLSDFPVVRFSGGAEALIDFRGGIPPRVADAISSQWKSLRVVSLADAGGAGDRIDRILGASGYHSVKEGISRPVVMGETVSVALPARWVIQRTEDSLLSGDLILLKEVQEKPDSELLAVLRYARRIGLRVLPYTDDPNTMEGFLVGIQEDASEGRIPVALAVPKAGGLPAVDIGLSRIGIPARTGERLRVGGEGDAFRLVVSPERFFEAGGKKYVVDTGRMSPAVRSILRESGYTVFMAGKDASGRDIFQRLMKAAEIASEERKEYLLAGGVKAGYEIRITGVFLSLPGPSGEAGRRIVLIHRKIHSATRALLGDMGVEIVEW
ncbi:MAG: LysM peptidoglycan-binding domain-containing protein [Deltaproteobacteria bacterium]|nr:MAG: LysM peptidoglycan-binding domain-containing protein [Deltaproteobacteria bacterium]